ncbi:hypothetical protein [Marinobacter lutaoensis]|jgi:hypothetical protein|uniref:Uncharacterized protein n=1 Tax=Marinobacter lutaoensis TaxID=135739 RepID=A0A1V2DW94_9GAMM|nr:hypothetical protein [Marinobacter lutaoensis]MBI43399.1 hypothetical protein [Oceanospirillales bacterium]MBI44335.1 hypothetical protein [Oceanospirillales bacterium]NVD36637.1 hypothetical protein [Marinobacter lutaoensis]ONF44807.1 hypothetical protein BTO32_03445 [Marinobacter lutaoensis]|tara:strand:- start:2872 stop:3210 length:339 start_codon:yes stop_codon:yes gene_type:complete
MPGFDNKPSHPWRTPLLILEFSSLALLLGSMAWLSGQAQTGEPLAPGWLLLPALASLGVFASFIGLMYLRWVAAAGARNQGRPRVVFALLAVTLLGIWLYGVTNTWLSLNTP